ncbi:general secretion pathway protein GspF [Ketobacter alkanivorans]|uniref:General secretion pathway protein GspF n=1 Tax=Ketobacter alkanivorans TaxID=1917421 RepID=A0A2K9LNP7_9GAMM|nr:general secretion pathway protein GspF [Ketobacter alkanivorans]AUM13893.1 general secretion pathway protein GspF [Ketobacter alkanivorans]MCP5017969.1 general secretion pathway protein GspF [Ketobacter sp.]
MKKKPNTLNPDTPLVYPDHQRPKSRRDFIRQGMMTGAASVLGPGIMGMFANPNAAYAALSGDIATIRDGCGISVQGAGKIPFICFDLAGGANIAGSNVLVGQQGGQEDFISTAGYNKMGLPGDMVPSIMNPDTSLSDFIDTTMGLLFHSDSAFARGIREKASVGALANVDGAVIPARSENDTGNNPHNPMYGIWRAGADGELLTLIGSRSSDSGGNSMAPAMMIDSSVRPTKVDRPSDVTGLVDTGKLVGMLDQADVVSVMESISRISEQKMAAQAINTTVTREEVIRDLIRCGYVKSADLADRYGNPATLNPEGDPDIVGPAGIFSSGEFSDGEFRKTASVMKLVVNGFAGAGTVTMGGFDYHTGDRSTGENRDLRAGRCMGACIEYAHRVGVPLFLYVFSDGSVASNGMIDDSVDGRGKGVWTGDNSSTAASFFLVYSPNGRASMTGALPGRQIGWFRGDGSVETASSPAANNPNLLVETVVLNYMALHGQQSSFSTAFPGHGLGGSSARDGLTVFQTLPGIVGGVMT